jgi:type I restriction enzyme M protein
MLDNITKKNIDDCRDVLVGKVPDPKSQIEQITLALIYKFMDDMDKEAVEKFKGKAKFFTGIYAKYGWRKLFDPSLSGQDMLALYSEALEKLNTNPNIPELFRNIFKNAYLPYRDPSTLKLFLKYINEFEYSHSEKLGDAFEYLLSVMGSQGDAGQFRTPRHIIDFVTACVNPQKNETILDPACGTAGFLLSAFKHIRNQNSKETEIKTNDNLGNPIIQKILIPTFTPDDRKKLATNFVGYDISPDMVRLSLANMYLHGFATPLIHEYDSLSSEDRWQETFDVILANPPFMTPKGGIRPHKKFGVKANKAEVLFTDYIAEHLNSNGRAGIVVPNGIVATSQTAYKQLRKMLVQDSLIAVISLPAGVFQPYSGVKTSVLILDKRLAKKSKHILFLKIENDGFDLGAQRREIDKNDLPLALQTLEAFKECLSNDKAFENLPSLATLVKKEIVLGNKDVVLSAERYFEKAISQTEFDLVNLADVCKVINGRAYKQDELLDKGKYLVLRVGNFFTNKSWYYSDLELPEDKYCDNGDLLYAWSASFGPKMWDGGKVIYHYHIWKMVPDENVILKKYLYLVLEKETERMKAENTNGSTMLHLTKEGIEQLEIPLPPLEIQQQIVAEIEGYQKIIDGAKQVVNNYKPTITINPDWEMVELGEVCEITSSKRIFQEEYVSEGIPFYRSKEVIELSKGLDIKTELFISNKRYDEIKSKFNIPKKGDILLTAVGTIGVTYVIANDNPFYFKDGNLVWLKEFKAHNSDFLKILLSQRIKEEFIHLADGAAYNALTIDKLKGLLVSKPTLEEQQNIVKAIEEEMQLVNSNKRLVELFEQKIKTKIGEVWGVKEEIETV